MAATAAPPPSGGVTIIDTPPPKPPPAPTSTIKVSSMPAPVEPTPAKPGSAMDRLRSDLQKKAKNQEPPPPAPETPPAKPVETPNRPGAPEPAPEPEPETPVDPAAVPAEPAPAAPVDPKAKGKTNPWKLVEQYKAKIAEAEKQLADAKTGSLQEQEKGKYLTQIEQLQKRTEELENEMRFVDYKKSAEFQQKYEQPYLDAWQAASTELSEITVTDEASGQVRAATPQDLLSLVNLPLGQAREVAEMVFGKFADDVMAHRKTLRGLFDAQAKALNDARTKGAEREKMRVEMMTKNQRELKEFAENTWDGAVKALHTEPKYGKYFTPTEGDEEANQRLTKGFEFVERALSDNLSDPNLTAEQRATAIKRHAALRHRAAAFGKVVHWLEQRDAKIAELEKELAQFKGSTPPAGGATVPQPQGEVPRSAKEEVFASLRKLAK